MTIFSVKPVFFISAHGDALPSLGRGFSRKPAQCLVNSHWGGTENSKVTDKFSSLTAPVNV